jgi:hypothetical protein
LAIDLATAAVRAPAGRDLMIASLVYLPAVLLVLALDRV